QRLVIALDPEQAALRVADRDDQARVPRRLDEETADDGEGAGQRTLRAQATELVRVEAQLRAVAAGGRQGAERALPRVRDDAADRLQRRVLLGLGELAERARDDALVLAGENALARRARRLHGAAAFHTVLVDQSCGRLEPTRSCED